RGAWQCALRRTRPAHTPRGPAGYRTAAAARSASAQGALPCAPYRRRDAGHARRTAKGRPNVASSLWPPDGPAWAIGIGAPALRHTGRAGEATLGLPYAM